MIKDYKWLGFGGEFGPDDERSTWQAFMKNVKIGITLLDNGALTSSGSGGDSDSVYLVLKHDAIMDEPEILPHGRQRDGTLLFTVVNNWLADDFLDEASGPWHVTAVVLIVLTALHRSGAIRLPELAGIGQVGH